MSEHLVLLWATNDHC